MGPPGESCEQLSCQDRPLRRILPQDRTVHVNHRQRIIIVIKEPRTSASAYFSLLRRTIGSRLFFHSQIQNKEHRMAETAKQSKVTLQELIPFITLLSQTLIPKGISLTRISRRSSTKSRRPTKDSKVDSTVEVAPSVWAR
jgi:hypothetical protein